MDVLQCCGHEAVVSELVRVVEEHARATLLHEEVAAGDGVSVGTRIALLDVAALALETQSEQPSAGAL
ncbi:MAG: hypothetical protein ACK41Y_16805, partial [Paracoccus hibiscisoli]|uniref:hypothetical protein n=1 Tax=Paracoccus hibiscisoli TaxID=2023261 RepID=UPI00391C017C